ncbi:hypothetical protein CPB83DRAFT_108404 [Crepidotus variabilis]|uniref:NACHT domain-containing protein n=1 Tax=Crepidotus variabilis TaxID=179855 RepID=A0A9P6JT26_9AGAR|nr:hypothetical protein CPB83DRAFT_108404 [Crepidotus variabilis]
MFNGSTLITGGTFQINNVQHTEGIKGLISLREASAPGALHNSSERFDPPKCHPTTRRAILNSLMEWARGSVASDQLMMWIYGAAGAGKSAIAQSLAEMCASEGILLACFFFSRTTPPRNTVHRLVATLAYQIALIIPAAGRFIEQLIEENPMIFDQSLETQFSKLIVQPLLHVFRTVPQAPHVVLIDGLDECNGAKMQAHIVATLFDVFQNTPFSLRILIASRPELHLKIAFSPSVIQPLLSTCVLDNRFDLDADIRRYLQSSFENIKQTHPFRRYIPSSWPATEVLETLVKKSSGQFIYASTVTKFVESMYHRPADRLEVVLGVHPSLNSGNMPFAELDALYTHIFSTVQDIGYTMDIIAAIFILDDDDDCLSSANIDDLLSFKPGETEMCLSQLASVIECSSDTGEIIVLHASLPDWLFDYRRAGQFFIHREHFLVKFLRQGLSHMQQNTGFRHPYMQHFPRRKHWKTDPPLLVSFTSLHDDLRQLSLATLWAKCSCDGWSISRFWTFIPKFLAFIADNDSDLHGRLSSECHGLLLSLLKISPVDTASFLVTMDLLLNGSDTSFRDICSTPRLRLECDFECDWLFLFGGSPFTSSTQTRTKEELLITYSFVCLFDDIVDPSLYEQMAIIIRDILREEVHTLTGHHYAKAAHRYLRYATSRSFIPTSRRTSVFSPPGCGQLRSAIHASNIRFSGEG